MKPIVLILGLSFLVLAGKSQDARKRIKTYFLGYEKKDWNLVASQLAPGFNFTSPNHDDHIPLATYKERCWSTAPYFKKIEFVKMMTRDNSAFIIYNITTTDNKVIRNAEYYTFRDGKIASIECFFGPGIGYPGSNLSHPK